MKFVKVGKFLFSGARGSKSNVFAAFASAFLFAAFFFSCQNMSGDVSAVNPALFPASAQKVIVFKGSVGTGESASVSLSALPSVTTGTGGACYYFVTATSAQGGSFSLGEDSASRFTPSSGGVAFELPLAVGDWTITVGLKAKGSNVIVMQSEPFEKTLTAEDSVISHQFTLLPVSGGSGSLALDFSMPSGSGYSNSFSWVDTNVTSPVSLDAGKLTASNVPAGNHDLQIKVIKNSFVVYSTVQTITIIKGMTTNKWVVGSSPAINSSGVLEITESMIQSYMAATIYVGVPALYQSNTAVRAEDTNSGRAAEPLASISAALTKIQNHGQASVDYRIMVSGEIKGNAELVDGLNGLNGKARSITIEGLTGPASDSLKGTGSGSVITVNSAVPVTIKNIKITGGNATNGGGIYVASGATVTLGEGACVAGNKASFGGGVYVDGSFTLDGGVIGDASKTEHATRSENSNSTTTVGTDSFGGGIFFSTTGKVTVKSGVIAYNYAFRGGGIASQANSYSADSQLTIKGGEIRYNCAETGNGEYNYNSFGGGVFVNGSKFSFTGGEIHKNYGLDGGGGLFLQNASVASMSGGSVHDNGYKDDMANCSKAGSDLLLWDNAVLNMSGGKISSASQKERGVIIWNATDSLSMSGSAFISQNTPVLLTENTYITIEGALTPPDGDPTKKNAYIVPFEWKRGTVIAKGKDGGQIPDGSENRLALADASGDGWETYGSIDGKQIKIKAPIYVSSADLDPAGLDTNIGTKSAPYATVTKALTDLNDPEVDYEIYIKGTVVDHVVMDKNTTNHAKSLLLKGYNYTNLGSFANDTLSGGCVADTDWSSPKIGRTLWVKGDVPVTIKALKITGGKENANGGGIFVDNGANLTLSYFTRIMGNYTALEGAGVYVDAGGTLNVQKNVTVKDNKTVAYSDSSLLGDSNVYLPSGKVINILDDLKGLGSEGDSEIWVSTQDQPTISGSGASATVTTVPITSGYKENNTNNGAVVAPSKYFKGDKYGVALVGNEAAFGVHGGGISVEDIYKNVALSVNKTWVTKAACSDGSARFTVSGTVDGNAVTFKNVPTGDYDASISLKLLYHGEEIPQTSSYYSVNASYPNQINLYGGLPAGDYVLAATVVHKGKSYSASFEIKVIGDSVPDGYVMTGGETVAGAVGTAAPSKVFKADRTVPIPVIIACKTEVTQAEYEKYCYYGTKRPTDALGKGDNYPAYYVSWYDALVYCNLRSIAEGLTPVYSIDGITDPKQWPGISVGEGDDIGKYRGTIVDAKFTTWNAAAFNQGANGWRLPTEAEWEYLARAANTMDYYCSGTSGDTEDDLRDYVWYESTASGAAHEVKTKQANALGGNGNGLYDMSGNVCEWCWDWKAATVDSSVPATGPDTGTTKVCRGGDYTKAADRCCVNQRGFSGAPSSASMEYVGFRVVRNAR